MAIRIEQSVFKTIVKMAYEMGKAEEQEQATKVFTDLMRFIFNVAIESDWKIHPYETLDEIVYEGAHSDIMDTAKYELLFRYFVWKRGIKEVRKVFKNCYSRHNLEHTYYAYRGNRYCKLDICLNMIKLYVKSKWERE